jgi:hypothetical protein
MSKSLRTQIAEDLQEILAALQGHDPKETEPIYRSVIAWLSPLVRGGPKKTIARRVRKLLHEAIHVDAREAGEVG